MVTGLSEQHGGRAGKPLRPPRPIVAVLLLALVLRALALWSAQDAVLVKDENGYVQRAVALLDGQGFVGSYQSWVRHEGWKLHELPQYPGAFQPPGYPAFMAAVMAPSGRSLLGVKLAQLLLSTLTVLVVYGLGRAWLDERRALVAALLCAVYPNLIGFSHLLWSETLFIALFLPVFWALGRSDPLRPLSPLSQGWALAAGMLLGLSALTRGSIVYFAPLLAAWIVVLHAPRWQRGLARAALVLLAAVAVVMPWTVRNQRVHDGFVLIDTNGAYNLWRGNTPATFALRDDSRLPHYASPFHGIPIFPVGNVSARVLVDELRRERGVSQPGDLEVVAYARERTRAAVIEQPGLFLRRAVLKLVDLWNPTSFVIRHYQIGGYRGAAPALEAFVTWSAVISYLLVAGLGLAGLVLLWRNPNLWIVGLLVLYFSAGSAAAFGLTRFRLPVMPLLMIPAAHVLVLGWDRWKRQAHG